MREFRDGVRAAFEENQSRLGDLNGLDHRLVRDATQPENPKPGRVQWAAGFAAILGLVLVGTLIVTRVSVQPRHLSTTTGEPVPWLNSPASPPTMQICRAVDLAATELGSNGAGGNVITSIGFGGKGPNACYLKGIPTITLLDASGNPISANQRPAVIPQPQPMAVLILPGSPPTPHHELGPGQGMVTVDWGTQTEACSGIGEFVDAVEITFSRDDRLVVPIGPQPRAYLCNGFGVGVFQGPPQAGTTPNIGVHTLPLMVLAIRSPSTVRVGDALRYEVELTNSGAVPIDFKTVCIDYEEELVLEGGSTAAALGGKHIYRLNCDAAPNLAPDQRITFEIVYFVPEDAPPGNYKLQFTLLTGTAPNPGIEGHLSILR